jgi:pimeloyl-ACP methyl ester carboxylesterase
MRLADGRFLGYSDWGDPDGVPVLYLHGAMGTPLRRCSRTDAALARLGVRYLLVQRPGFGGSDPRPSRTLRDFSADLAALCDHLSLGRVHLVGVSAGGPYAVAAAHALPERVASAAVVSGLGPAARPPRSHRAVLGALRRDPGAVGRRLDALVALARRHPERLVWLLARRRGPDGSDLADAEAGAIFAESFLQATRGGVGPMLDDLLLATGPWGFDVGAVGPHVHVWHGTRDPLVPVEQALHLAIALPRCTPMLAPGEGHFFFRRRMTDVLGALVAPPPEARAQPGAAAASRTTSAT